MYPAFFNAEIIICWYFFLLLHPHQIHKMRSEKMNIQFQTDKIICKLGIQLNTWVFTP